eukprot:1863978-Rhodomonas_salina.1
MQLALQGGDLKEGGRERERESERGGERGGEGEVASKRGKICDRERARRREERKKGSQRAGNVKRRVERKEREQ